MTEASEVHVPYHLKPPPGPPPADIVVGSDTSLMDGYVLEYKYSTGREYQLTFTAEDVTFKMLDSPNYKPEYAVPVSLPYLVREVREGQMLVHWMVPGRVGHVSLIIDLGTRTIYVSALMPFKMEFFDVAPIHLIKRHDEVIE